MLVNRIGKIMKLGALTLLLSSCHSATQSKQFTPVPYFDNGDGTVTDIQTNLTWQRCSVGQLWTEETCIGEPTFFTWDDAMQQAKDGWRLPTVDELDTLVLCSNGQRTPSVRPNGKFARETNGKCPGSNPLPTINRWAFPNTPTIWYWSSSSYAEDSGVAWVVGFGNGNVYNNSKFNDYHVRLVSTGH
ncbi:DUF1566 domain-containing protein [Arsukibacterium perlucidum]|uniref:Lcl C-terminal domain-containing protein n=1 Tax=Arsukibacterium perlucidum TaxID=368811 RepID=UPI0003705412|nr:DUF1566 domain-containing protein [Arsukibacterium perlucidum]